MSGTHLVDIDPDELETRAIAITGSTAWRAKLARLLGTDDRTVRRWVAAQKAPPWLPYALLGLEWERGLLSD